MNIAENFASFVGLKVVGEDEKNFHPYKYNYLFEKFLAKFKEKPKNWFAK